MINAFGRLRNKSGLKQIEVAEKLNTNQTTVSMWETGSSLPRAEMLPKLAALYGCTVDDLLSPGEEETETA